MKDREISRLVFLNVALGVACVLSGIFFLWLHNSVGAAPGGGAEETASGSLVRFAPTTRVAGSRFLDAHFSYRRQRLSNILLIKTECRLPFPESVSRNIL